jgi:MFS family permease
MVSAPLKKKRFYGWFSLAGVMLASASMMGNIVISFGVFLPEMCNDLGWSRSALSAPYTIFWIVMGVLGPLAGISAARFGGRRNIIIGNIGIVLGAVGMSFAHEVWHVYLFYSLLIGIGQAFGSFIAANSIIANWFVRRRALAISLLAASGGAGGLIFPTLLGWFISSYGWRPAWIYVAGVNFVLAVVGAGLLIRNSPEEMGQTPDGEAAGDIRNVSEQDSALGRVFQTTFDWKARDALRTSSFWLTVAFASSTMFTMNFLSLHQVAYLQDMGYSAMIAATTAGVLGGMGIIGQLASGVMGNRFEGRHIAAVCTIGLAAGVAILMNCRLLPLIYLHTVLSGISAGGIMVVLPVVMGSYFGRANYSQILGWTTPVTTIFSSGSPLLAAFIFDATGSYTPVFIMSLGFLAFGLGCALFSRPPRPPSTAGISL